MAAQPLAGEEATAPQSPVQVNQQMEPQEAQQQEEASATLDAAAQAAQHVADQPSEAGTPQLLPDPSLALAELAEMQRGLEALEHQLMQLG